MNFCILFSCKKINLDKDYNININVITNYVGVWVKKLNLFLQYYIINKMSINTLKKKEIIGSKSHLTSYNIVNVCKNTIVIGDEDLQNYNKVDLPG